MTDLPDASLVARFDVQTWSEESAPRFAAAYAPAFSDRPGFPGWSEHEWIEHVTANDLVPDWSLLANIDDKPAGFVIACTDSSLDPPGGYVWQVGVVASERGAGIGSGLMVESMKRMKAAGARWVDLTVHTDNPRAIHVYERLGFAVVGRRARYGRLPREEN